MVSFKGIGKGIGNEIRTVTKDLERLMTELVRLQEEQNENLKAIRDDVSDIKAELIAMDEGKDIETTQTS